MLLARTVVCVTSLTVAAFAAVPSPALRLKARNLYAAGEKALDAGNVDEAEHDFEEAYRTLPNAAVLLKIADCKVRLGDGPGAVDTLQRSLTDKKTAADRTPIETRIDEIRKKPGVVTVTTTPSGAAIWVDGADSGKTTPADIEVFAGDHTFSARLPDHETADKTLTVVFASRPTVDFTLAEKATPVESAPPAATTPEPTESNDTGYRLTPAFWVAVGGTVVGAGVMTGFGVAALDKHSEYQKKPSRSLYDDGRRDALIADVALGVSAASAITAAVLFFTSNGDEKSDEQAFGITPTFGCSGGGVTGYVRF